MRSIDLTTDFADLVRRSRSTIEFKSLLWTWLDGQRRDGGPLEPLLSDLERHWSSIGEPPSLARARHILRHLEPGEISGRIEAIGARFAEETGERPEVDVVLLAGLERPEGYSRFDRGRNTIFLGLDHPAALTQPRHLELILSHELCHAVRDPDPAVLADYGGASDMTHDDFVARHPLREHIVSEALATAISSRVCPGLSDERYVFLDHDEIAWCLEHRAVVADRIERALERREPYRTFFAADAVAPGSPASVDYWFALRLGRLALERETAGELLHAPASVVLERYLDEVLADLRSGRVDGPAPASGGPSREDALAGDSLPPTVRATYDDYAAIVGRRPELAVELERRFADLMAEEGLEYDGCPWEVHAFPVLLAADEFRHLRWVTAGLLRLIERAIDLYREEPEVRTFFGLPPRLEELALLDPGFRPHLTMGRFDSYWSGRRVRFLEINVNGAACWDVSEILSEAALELPALGDILARHGASSLPLTASLLAGMLDAWSQARDGRELGRIAIVDRAGLPTATELLRLARDFTRMGVPAGVASPEQLSFDGRQLLGPDGPIDLVYRRLTALDIAEADAALEPLLEAARRDAVVTVASYASDVAHSKRLFAFLTHERWQHRFAPEERALIDAHVPWTRVLAAGRTQYEGRSRDLLALAVEARSRFVLKPAEGLGGRGVLIGHETDPDHWAAEVERRAAGGHILQEVVAAPVRNLLLAREGRIEQAPRWLHLGEFVIAGQLAGFLARASEELVLSPASRERILPCLLLADDREAESAP